MKTKTKTLILIIFLFLVAVLFFGCMNQTQNAAKPQIKQLDSKSSLDLEKPPPDLITDSRLDGIWRFNNSSSLLTLYENGSWSFENNHGYWTTKEIEERDWSEWGLEQLSSERKIVFYGWSGKTIDGPIEENEGEILSFWVISKDRPGIGFHFQR